VIHRGIEIASGLAFMNYGFHLNIIDGIYWAGVSMLLVGVSLLGHAAYVSHNRIINRRFRTLYEAVLGSAQ